MLAGRRRVTGPRKKKRDRGRGGVTVGAGGLDDSRAISVTVDNERL